MGVLECTEGMWKGFKMGWDDVDVSKWRAILRGLEDNSGSNTALRMVVVVWARSRCLEISPKQQDKFL